VQIAIEMYALARFEKHRVLAPRDGMFAESADALPVLSLFPDAGFTGGMGHVTEFEDAVGRHNSPPESRAAKWRNLQL
jgi:hypothetical protein